MRGKAKYTQRIKNELVRRAYMRLSRRIVNILTLLIMILVLLAVCEIGLRVWDEQKTTQRYWKTHHENIPGSVSFAETSEYNVTYRINGDGMRDDEVRPKEEYDMRILMLGDSFTFGQGVNKEETFSDVLEKKLNASGIHADVLNAGVVSYSPILEYVYLREKGLQYDPDIVIVNFDMSDVYDDKEYGKLAVLDAEGDVEAVPPPGAGGLERLRLYNFIEQKVRKPKPYRLNVESFDIFDFPEVMEKSRYAITLEIPFEYEASYWERTLQYLVRMKMLTDERNISLVLSTYPYGHQVSPEEWKIGRETYGLIIPKEYLDREIYSLRPHFMLKYFAEQRNITYVSMFPGFLSTNVHPLFYDVDGHFTPEGHALAADVLFRGLQERGIVAVNKNV